MRAGEAPGWALAMALLLATAPLAGCLSGEDSADTDERPTPPEDEREDREEDTSGEDANASDEEEASRGEAQQIGPPTEIPWYFTDDGGLAAEPPANGSTALPSGTARDIVHFATDSFPAAFLLDNEEIQLRLFVTTETPRAAGSGFDIVAWAGTTVSTATVGATSVAEGPMQPGEVYEVELTLSNEAERSLLVPKGAGIEVLLTTQGGGELILLTGGDTPSSVTTSLRGLAVDPTADLGQIAEDTITGTIAANGQFFNCDVQEGVTTAYHSLEVSAETSLELSMQVPGGSGEEDLDMTLLDGDTTLASTAGPGAEEGILLAGPTLDGLSGRELTLKVTGCTAANTSYEILVQQA